MIAQRYQIFLSSTFRDLEAERLAVTQALLKMRRCIPAGMEMFPASNRPPWDVITSVLDTTDYLVLVVAGRYGSVKDGVSYTEREYDYAYDHGIPVLPFVHSNPGSLPADRVEADRATKRLLAAFVKKLEERHHVLGWTRTDDLALQVTKSLGDAFIEQPRPGWVRGSATRHEIAEEPQLRVTVAPTLDSPLRPVSYDDAKVDAYVNAATERLLAELPSAQTRTAGDLGPSAAMRSARIGGGSIFGMNSEDRTEEEFKREVEIYAEQLAAGLRNALEVSASLAIPPFAVSLGNASLRNYEDVLLELHIEGAVRAVEVADEDARPLDELPDEPRAWGPYQSTISIPSFYGYKAPPVSSFVPSVEIHNGGSATIRYPSVHLRPRANELVDEVTLLVDESAGNSIHATWRATATNIDGEATGEFHIPIEGDVYNPWKGLLANSDD